MLHEGTKLAIFPVGCEPVTIVTNGCYKSGFHGIYGDFFVTMSFLGVGGMLVCSGFGSEFVSICLQTPTPYTLGSPVVYNCVCFELF
jgi:hypothetical protein